MDPAVRTVLALLMRWTHVISVITLLGGFVYARLVLAPALAALPGTGRRALGDEAAARFRPILITVVFTILGSGLYNYMTKGANPPGYHMWMGIKLLLVLHVLAASLLYAASGGDEAKRNRRATGILISGVAIVLISGWLRYISTNPAVRLP
ncbi:MAG: hypothetical protein ABSF98_17315 [Bryobacteraceae bacterium]|jgi:hypothetical protein